MNAGIVGERGAVLRVIDLEHQLRRGEGTSDVFNIHEPPECETRVCRSRRPRRASRLDLVGSHKEWLAANRDSPRCHRNAALGPEMSADNTHLRIRSASVEVAHVEDSDAVLARRARLPVAET
jgi:hypothetical protein